MATSWCTSSRHNNNNNNNNNRSCGDSSFPMAKLVSLYRPDESPPLSRCQLPLPIDDSFTMVAEFGPLTVPSNKTVPTIKELSGFLSKYNLFVSNELSSALTADEMEFYSLMSRYISCVGCRRSIERLYGQLIELGTPALDPFVVDRDGFISLSPRYIRQPELLYALFTNYGSKLNSFVDSIPKAKKSRRCLLHSLDGQKVRMGGGNWLEVWDSMERECRQETVVIEQDVLQETVEVHLKKNRFCPECKTKVWRAYDLLVQNVDVNKETGFVPSLYEGIRYCSKERHIHTAYDTDYVARLIRRAEPEMRGSGREKHAKTIDVAQEEILVCIGICLNEQLHRISQRLREEAQTWLCMFHLCVECLKTNFEVFVEEKQGFSQLELVCEQIQNAEMVKQQKRKHKRQKRKLRKNKLRSNEKEIDCDVVSSENEVEERHEVAVHDRSLSYSPCPPADEMDVLPFTKSIFSVSNSVTTPRMSPCSSCYSNEGLGSCIESGYSSCCGNDSPWSLTSSCSCSEMASSESCSIHEEESQEYVGGKKSNESSLQGDNRTETKFDERVRLQNDPSFRSASPTRSDPPAIWSSMFVPSLEDLLKASRPSEAESYIPPEELKEMRAKVRQYSKERLELRENLKLRFADLQQRNKFRFRPFAFRKNVFNLCNQLVISNSC